MIIEYTIIGNFVANHRYLHILKNVTQLSEINNG